MQLNQEKRPGDGGLTPIEAVIEVAKSDCPSEWARYGDLADRLPQPKSPTEISKEEAGRQLLVAHSKFFHQKRAIGRLSIQPVQLEKMISEALDLQRLFRNRFVAALQSGRYSIEAFHGLEPHTLNPALIKPEHFRFDSDEMEVNGIKLHDVHFKRRDAIAACQNDPPGRKPGQKSVKDLACCFVLSNLNGEARPPNRRGRLTDLARKFQAVLEKDGKSYQVNTIEGYIRDTVREWEKKNPGK
jgi:hypothetical protein